MINRKNRRILSAGLSASLAAFLTIFAFVGANGAGDLGFDSQVDYSVDLANANSYKNTTAQILPSSGAYSFEAWVYDNEVNTTRDEHIALVSGSSQFLIHTGTGTQNIFLWGSTTSNGLGFVNAQLPVKQWTHLAVTFSSSGTITFYMNGVATFTSSGLSRSTAAVGLSVGADALNASTTRFNGRIDEVKVWSEDRSASISSDMHTYGSDGTSTFASGLSAYYDFNEGSGTTAFDRTSGNKHLTFSGTGAPNYLDVKENGITSAGNPNTILKFPRTYLTSTGGWKVPQDVSKIDALVIAGGGSGGSIADTSGIVGGGGGAGGMTESSAITVTPGNTIAVSVGQGGLAPAGTAGTSSSAGTNGQSSSLGSLLTAAGGGAGGTVDTAGSTGGSGGGGGVRAANSSSAALAGGSASDSAKGNVGGVGCAGTGSNTHFGAGGGGGAGGAGGNADCTTTPTGGSAGAGKASSITGSAVTYAGGGAGGGSTTNGAPSTLTSAQTPAGTSGAANTGSGGGGAYARTGTATAAGLGGSGVVIISYAAPIDYALTLNGTNQYLTAPITDATTSLKYSFDFNTGSTIELWVKPSTVSCASGCTVVGKNDVFKLQIKNGKWGLASKRGSTWDFSDTKTPATANRWQHIAITKSNNGTRYSFWLDGKNLFGPSSLYVLWINSNDSGTFDSVNPVVVGKSPDLTSDTEFFAGQIDQLKFWSGSSYTGADVSTSRQQHVGSGTSGTTYTNQVSAYDFNDITPGSIPSHVSGGLQLVGVNLTSSSFTPVAVTSTPVTGLTTVTFDRTYLSAANGWTVPAGVSKISGLVVGAGGGGGANTGAGGAGGSSVFVNPSSVSPGQKLAVSVGAGGIGGYSLLTSFAGATTALTTADSQRDGTAGGNSTLRINGTLVATGSGGNGGPTFYSDDKCTSTGSQASNVSTNVVASSSTAGDTAIFANTGVGGAATSTSGGTSTAGGNGLAFNITGTDSFYGGGGAGGGYNSATSATGGSGGGGNGGNTGSTTGSNGTLGTGGGGGGGETGCANGGSGDNGVVVIAYGKLLQLNGKMSRAISGQTFPTPFVASTVDGGSATISAAGYGANTGLTLTGTTASSTTTTSAVFRDLAFTASSGTFGSVYSAPGYVSTYQATTIGQLPSELDLGNVNTTSNGSISGGLFIASTAAPAKLLSADLANALSLGDVRLEATSTISCTNTAAASAHTVTSTLGSLSLVSRTGVISCTPNTDKALTFEFQAPGKGFQAKAASAVAMNSSINTNQGAVTFWSDSDASNGGAIKYWFGTISTKGGNIFMGGGLNLDSGYAQGDSIYSPGINISLAAVLDTATGSTVPGDITLRGKAKDSMSGSNVSSLSTMIIEGESRLISGDGAINIYCKIGSIQGTSSTSVNLTGIYFNSSEIRSTTGPITIDSSVDDSLAYRTENSFARGSTGGGRYPFRMEATAASGASSSIVSTTGKISLNLTISDLSTSSDTNSVSNGAFAFGGSGSAKSISSTSGDIEITCQQVTQVCLSGGTLASISTSGNVTVTGDRMTTVDGTTFGNTLGNAASTEAINFSGSGSLQIQPSSGSWNLAQRFGLKVGASIKKVLIGKSTNTSDVTLFGSSSYVASTTEDYAIFGRDLTCTNYAVRTVNFSAKLTGNFSCSNTGHNWSKFALSSSASTPTIAVPSAFNVVGDKFTPQDRSISGFGDFTATYGIPAKLAIVTQPSSPIMIGAAITTQPVVSVVDSYGNHPSGINALASNFSGKVVTAASTESTFRSDTATSAIVSNVAKASFSGLEPLTIATGARPVIQFTSPGLTPVSSVALDQLQAATITFSYPDATFPTATTKTFSTNNTGGTVTYSSNSTAVCTVDSSTGVVTLVTSGTCSIKVTVGASGIYGLTTQDASFTVNPGAQNAITWAPSIVTFTAPNTLSLSGATGGIASTTYTYSVTDAGTAVCSITGTILSASTEGTCTVKATGTKASYETKSSADVTFTVTKASQASISWTPGTTTFNYNATLTLSGATGGSSTASIVYEVVSGGTASGCSISSAVLSSTSAGTCLVKATKAADAKYLVASSSSQTFTVNKISQTTALGMPSGLSIDYNSSTGIDLSPAVQNYSGGDGTGAYQVSTATAGCSINATTKVLTAGTNNAGTTCVVSVTRAADTNYLASTAETFTVAINKIAHPVITVTSASSGVWGTNISLTSSTISGDGVVTWSKVSGANCSVSGTTLSSSGAGNCVVKVSVASGTNYLAAESANFTVSLNKQNQTSLSWNLTSTSVPYLGTLALDTSGGSGTGAVIYSVSNGSACSIVGSTLVPSEVGSTCDITATKVSDSNYNSADTTTQSITVTKISQASVSFSNGTALTYGQTMDLLAVGGSGSGAISYTVTSAGTTGCTIAGVRLSVTGAGTCALSASRAGSTNYNISNTATLSVIVSKAAQSVNFTSTVPAEPIAGDTYNVTAATTSGLTPLVTVSSGTCTISGGVVTFGAGTCVIQAESSSTNQYLAASSVTQTIAVGQRNQTLNFAVGIASLTTKTYGDPAFFAQATSTEATLSPTFATGSATTNSACAVSSTGVVVIVAVGTCEVEASQAGTADVAAASTIRKSFTVVPDQANAPFVTSVSAGHETITAAFIKPTYIGGSAITGYQIVAVAGGTTVVNSACSVNGSGTTETCSVNGLNNGTSYRIKVAAITAAGIGVYSDLSASRVPATNPAAVSAFTAVPNNTVIDLTWQDPISLGGGTFDSYRIFFKKTTDASYPNTYITVQSQTPRSYQITGLINGEAYDVKIVTVTTANTQALVSNTAEVKETPRTVPEPPATIEVIEVAGDLVITWSTPLSDGGNAISEYRVTINGTVCTMTNALDTVCIVPAPTSGGSYPIEVKAKNDAGLSSPAMATFTKAGVPSSGGGGTESAPSADKAIEVLALSVKNVASSGGQLVTVTGKNFKDVTTILVGGVKARVIQVSDTVIKFVAPGNLKGNASLEIKSPVASATVKDAFSYYKGVAKASVRWILGYVQANTTLKASDRLKLKRGLEANPAAIAVTCVGYQSYAYNTPKDAQTAIGRAKQACNYLKSINPKLSVKTVIARTNLTGTPSRKLAVQFRAIK